MRLTLRTMLAYLDDVLEPADAKALGMKIEESEFATALVHRIRSCTRRLRLGAPKLDGKGMGLDPNTVAEYLDSTLPQDRVPDFEKVCLESDVHLAEVASCHQILTLVLGEPATVEPQLRDKIYMLPEQVGIAAAVHAAEELVPSSTNGSPAVETPDVITKRPQVPDYLRVARRGSWKSIAATVTVALLVIVAALLALGPLDESHPILGAFLQESVVTKEDGNKQRRPSNTKQRSVATQQNTTTQRSSTTPQAGNSKNAQRASSQGTKSTKSTTIAAATVDADAETSPSASSTESASIERTEVERTEVDVIEDRTVDLAGSDPADDAAANRTDTDAAANDSGDTETPSDDTSESSDAEDSSAPDSTSADLTSPDATSPDAATADDASPASAVEVGRFLAGSGERKHVVARFDVQAGWMRVPEREVLHAGDELLVLPSYRPQIALTSGLQLILVGPSRVTLGAPDPSDAPVLRMRNASALIETAAVAGSRIIVDLPDRRAEIVFATPDATLAIHVQRNWPLGVDPAQERSPFICRLMATNGQLEWREGDGEAIVINSGQTLVAIGADKPSISDDMSVPDWASGKEIPEIENRATKQLELELQKSQESESDAEPTAARSLALTLREHADHRQVEVAALAISSLAAMYEFEPALASLLDEKFRSYWRSQYDVIQWALSSDQTAVDNLKAALDKKRPEDAAILYRLMWGYTNEQLAGGEDKKLVDLLEDGSMDVRVLAFENLRRITDHPSLYRPDRDPASQRRHLQDWKGILEKKQIRWKE